MHLKRTSIDSLARTVQSELEKGSFTNVDELLESLRGRITSLLESSEQNSAEMAVEKGIRNTVWACIFDALRKRIKEEDIPEMKDWIKIHNGTNFQRASHTLRKKLLKNWLDLRDSGEIDLLLGVFEKISPLGHQTAMLLSNYQRMGAHPNMTKRDFGASSGTATFQGESHQLAEVLNKLADDKEDFLKLYDESYRYLVMLALVPVESICVRVNREARNAFYKDESGKVKNKKLDDRKWVNEKLYAQWSQMPRTGCPAAISFEGMSLIRLAFDEYKRYLKLIPASTYC